jgi:hypothetical protein
VLCDAKNEYIHDFKMYKGSEERDIGHHIIDICQELLQFEINKSKEEGKKFTLYCDNLYTSTELAALLNEGGNDMVGTLRENRVKRFDIDYHQHEDINIGEFEYKG